jgi:predicted TIM-barrel fold metal-dependent hydrolase
MIQAYNDWHIDTWCGTYPGRFIPLALPMLWDPKLMADEIRRVAKKGCHAICFADNPTGLGYPSLHSDFWEPVWRAAADEGTVIAIHIGSGTGMKLQDTAAPVEIMITASPISLFGCATELVFSKFLREYPGLKIALSEGGIGWVPYFLDRADYVYKHHHHWTHQDFGGKLPSDVFREHIITCFIDDPSGVRNRDLVGIDTITWESDYPHSDTTWPNAPEELAKSLDGVSDEDVRKITHENAMRHFRYDPFSVIPKEQCTVGALRAQAKHVDLSLKSGGGTPPAPEDAPYVTIGHIMKQLAQAFATPFEGSGPAPELDPEAVRKRWDRS